MSEVDYVIPELSVSQETIIDLKELYKIIYEWFEFHNYDLYEKEHIDKLTEEGKNPAIKFECEKKADDYTKFHIEVKIKGFGLKDVQLKKQMACKGKVSVKFEAFLEKDYENNWGKTFFIKFLRSCYDYFILKGKFDKYAEELKEETYDIFNKTKAFLKLHGM